jgi:hypothetical protein
LIASAELLLAELTPRIAAESAKLTSATWMSCSAKLRTRSKYFHLAMRHGRKIAKVAMAGRLAVALFWMWRQKWNYEQLQKFGFARGTAWKSLWCAVNHRRYD